MVYLPLEHIFEHFTPFITMNIYVGILPGPLLPGKYNWVFYPLITWNILVGILLP